MIELTDIRIPENLQTVVVSDTNFAAKRHVGSRFNIGG